MNAWRARPMGRVGGVAAVALVLAAAPACGVHGPLAGRASDDWVRTYELPPDGTFEVRNSNGLVEVEGVDTRTLEVRAERIVKSTSDDAAREVLDRLGIDEEIEPDHVSLRTQGLDGIVIGVSVETRYHIKAPRALTLKLRTTNGSISLTGLEGAVTAQSTNGNVTGVDLKGGLDARTTNGRMRIDFAGVGDAPIQLRTTNGGLTLGLPESTAADLSLSVTNGTTNVDGLPFEPTGEQTRRRVRGRLNGGGTSIELTTTNGSVHVGTRASAAGTDDKPEP